MYQRSSIANLKQFKPMAFFVLVFFVLINSLSADHCPDSVIKHNENLQITLSNISYVEVEKTIAPGADSNVSLYVVVKEPGKNDTNCAFNVSIVKTDDDLENSCNFNMQWMGSNVSNPTAFTMNFSMEHQANITVQQTAESNSKKNYKQIFQVAGTDQTDESGANECINVSNSTITFGVKFNTLPDINCGFVALSMANNYKLKRATLVGKTEDCEVLTATTESNSTPSATGPEVVNWSESTNAGESSTHVEDFDLAETPTDSGLTQATTDSSSTQEDEEEVQSTDISDETQDAPKSTEKTKASKETNTDNATANPFLENTDDESDSETTVSPDDESDSDTSVSLDDEGGLPIWITISLISAVILLVLIVLLLYCCIFKTQSPTPVDVEADAGNPDANKFGDSNPNADKSIPTPSSVSKTAKEIPDFVSSMRYGEQKTQRDSDESMRAQDESEDVTQIQDI